MDSGRQGKFGRVRQKRRTRNQLLRAAAALMDRGLVPTVSAAADEADVSRRTAYRYFSTQEQLLAEVSLERLRPRVAAIIDSASRRQDPAAALEFVVGEIQRLAVENEALLRAMVRLTVDRQLGQAGPVRGSRRIGWIESALAAVKPRLRKPHYERLVSALSLCLGVEALIILQDVRGLRPEDSIAVCRWAARSLLDAALRDAKG